MITQAEQVLIRLRELLMIGEYAPGEHLHETVMAERFGVSRTPVRLAFAELAREGLMEYKANRGFIVREFSVEHILAAVDVREILEGAAARMAARRPIHEEHRRTLEACLLQADGLLAKTQLQTSDARVWSDINGTFHEAVAAASGNPVLIEQDRRLEAVPMAAARSMALTQSDPARLREVLVCSQLEHRWTYEAIVSGDAERAEMVFRQHIRAGRAQVIQALEAQKRDPVSTRTVPLARLVRVDDTEGSDKTDAYPPAVT